jgi:alginate O-acetyltransferase complex protein AlgI
MRFMRRHMWGSKYLPHLIAMGLIGFWHGANWTFIVFGLYWGCVIAAYLFFLERRAAVSAPLENARANVSTGTSILAMFVIACIGWVLFRAQSMTDAWTVLARSATPFGDPELHRPEIAALPILWLLIGGLWLAEAAALRWPALPEVVSATAPRRLAARYGMLVAILFAYVGLQQGVARPFIYFQF